MCYAGRLAALASLLLLSGCQTVRPVADSEDPTPQAHHAFAEHAVEGSPFAQVFRGNADAVVLTFFDLYCMACQQSADNFNALPARLQEALPGKRIQVTGVGIGDTELELQVFTRKYALKYPSLPDPEKAFAEPFGIKGTPTVLVFRREGADCLEVYRHEGRFRATDIDNLIEILR